MSDNIVYIYRSFGHTADEVKTGYTKARAASIRILDVVLDKNLRLQGAYWLGSGACHRYYSSNPDMDDLIKRCKWVCKDI